MPEQLRSEQVLDLRPCSVRCPGGVEARLLLAQVLAVASMVFLLMLRRERRRRTERMVLAMGLVEWVEEMEDAVDGLLV